MLTTGLDLHFLPVGRKLRCCRRRDRRQARLPRSLALKWVRVRFLQRIKAIANVSFTMAFIGAGNRTRTCTLTQWNLNPPSLPIPPCPHIQLTVESGELAVIALRFSQSRSTFFPILCNHCKLMKILFRTGSPLPGAGEASSLFLPLLLMRYSFWK